MRPRPLHARTRNTISISTPVDQSAAKTLRERPETVTTTELLSTQLQATQPREVGTRTLTVGGVAVALVSTDVARLNPITATSSAELPALEMLAALAGHDPTGVMVVEDAAGGSGFAFNVEHGRVTGARGPGAFHDLKLWAKELHTRFPERVTTPPPGETDAPGPEWVDLARDFVREHTLESLESTTTPGTRITLLRGDVEWQGPTLPSDVGLGLQHLLLEQARRHDELPRMLQKLGDLGQLALPMYEPGPLPPGGKPTPTGDADGWGDAEPDPANRKAWDLARSVYHLCDGQRSIAELIDYGMLGRFRTLEAVILLAKSQSLIVVDAPNKAEPPPAPKVLKLPAPPRPRPQAAPLEDPSRPSTGYMLRRRARERVQMPGDARPEPVRPRVAVKPRKPTRRPPPPPAAKPPAPTPEPERIPMRTRVEAHAEVVTPKPPSVRNEGVGGGQTLLDALEAEIAALDAESRPQAKAPPTRAGIPWQYILLALVGSLLFAGGAAFSMMLG